MKLAATIAKEKPTQEESINRLFEDSQRIKQVSGLPHRRVAPSRNDTIQEFFKTKFPKYGYLTACVMHTISGLTSIKQDILPKAFKKTFDHVTIGLSKFTTSANYLSLAIEALKEKRMFDFFARILDPLFVPWMKLEDIHLARGMSAGASLMDFSQNHKLQDKDRKGVIPNIIANTKATVSMIKEMIQGGIGKDRKVIPVGEKDEGHTMHFFGQLISLGSFLGVAFGANKRNLMNKLGGVIRNLGGFLGDMTMMSHGDKAFKLSGAFYAANAVIDAVQRFLPQEIIDPINHFNMILNNLGTYFYAEISRRRNEGKFEDSFDQR